MQTRPLVNQTVIFAAIAALLIGIALPVMASAAEYSAGRKVGRALAALACGFLEVPGNIVKTTRERGPAWGFTLGLAEGLGKMVPRHMVGAYELVSAPFPMPKGFKPIIQPEFPWDYFTDESKSAR